MEDFPHFIRCIEFKNIWWFFEKSQKKIIVLYMVDTPLSEVIFFW